MPYIEPQFDLGEMKIIIRPFRKKRNHIKVICHAGSIKEKKVIHKELKKAIRRMNRLLKQNTVSLELNLTLQQAERET